MNEDALRNYCHEFGVELLVLFGSSARGSEHSGSDIDIALKMKSNIPVPKLDLIYHFGELFDDHEIDLVVLSVETDPVLLYEIFSQGKPLYEGRPDIFEEERLRAIKLYFDTEKLRKFQAEYLRNYAARASRVA